MDVQGVRDRVRSHRRGGDHEQTNDRRVIEPHVPQRSQVGLVHPPGVGRNLPCKLNGGSLAFVEARQIPRNYPVDIRRRDALVNDEVPAWLATQYGQSLVADTAK